MKRALQDCERLRIAPHGLERNEHVRKVRRNVAAIEARKMLVTPPVDAGTKVRCVHSLRRRMARRIWMPHSWPGPER